jgi:hypothetical protein
MGHNLAMKRWKPNLVSANALFHKENRMYYAYLLVNLLIYDTHIKRIAMMCKEKAPACHENHGEENYINTNGMPCYAFSFCTKNIRAIKWGMCM